MTIKLQPPVPTGDLAALDKLANSLVALVNMKEAERERGNRLAGPHYRAAPSSTPSTPYYTGPNSLFGMAGLERDIITTRIQPMGLADRLPVLPTNVMQPLFPYLMGFGSDVGNEANGVCDDPPVPGSGQSCIQTAQFGRFSRQTRVVELTRIGQVLNRGEFTDLRFMNDPLLGGEGGITYPSNISGAGPDDMRREILMRMIELGISFQLWLTKNIYQGNPANNTGGNGYMEFPGLDILIGTTKVDALTGVACDGLDSDIKNFTYLDVSSSGTTIVSYLSYMLRYLRYNADHMNFGDTSWAIALRPELFYELTAVWPCAYMTYRCSLTGNNTDYVEASEMIRMRDDMRNGSYLLIDGVKYPVIQDSRIHESNHINNPANITFGGHFASDIYVIPLSVRGGVPVTYWEFFDYRESLRFAGGDGGQGIGSFFWTDGGRYMWHFKPPTNFCLQWVAEGRQRIIMRTPQLAGRLTNVAYTPLQHTRDVAPNDPYFLGGGNVAGVTSPALHAEWSPVSLA